MPLRRQADLALRACAALLLAGVALPFLPFPGTTDVQSFWLPWMQNLAELGALRGYAANASDYPPGCAIILTATVRVADALGLDHFVALKWSILLFLWATTLIVWRWTRQFAAAVALELALLLESVALGYIDVYFAPWLVAALWALQQHRLRLSTVCFTLACLTKWQPLILAPFLAVYVLAVSGARLRGTAAAWRAFAADVLLPSGLLAAAALALFGRPVLDSLRRALGHDYLSGQALNFNWILTHWIRVTDPAAFGGLNNGIADFIVTGDPQYTVLPKLLFVLFYGGAVVAALRRARDFGDLLRFSVIGYLAYFTFNTGVHENHLFLAMVVALVLYAVEGASELATATGIVLLGNINLVLFYGMDGRGYPFSRLLFGVDMALLFSIVSVLWFAAAYAAVMMRREAAHERPLS